ncbi:MAG: 30S ribosomal protein S17e [Thermoplasmatales archaeon]|nr:30S ribosomal protein S17e [Thermoplasmatales archaeon]
MGNIKPSFIKNIAIELVDKFPDVFSDDFEKNKLMVEKFTTIKSKNTRNRVAGYIARMMEDRKKKNEEGS